MIGAEVGDLFAGIDEGSGVEPLGLEPGLVLELSGLGERLSDEREGGVGTGGAEPVFGIPEIGFASVENRVEQAPGGGVEVLSDLVGGVPVIMPDEQDAPGLLGASNLERRRGSKGIKGRLERGEGQGAGAGGAVEMRGGGGIEQGQQRVGRGRIGGLRRHGVVVGEFE